MVALGRHCSGHFDQEFRENFPLFREKQTFQLPAIFPPARWQCCALRQRILNVVNTPVIREVLGLLIYFCFAFAGKK